MKIYIAGKVTGLPVGEVFAKFGQAEFWLKEQGHEVVNPLRLCSQSWSWQQCMRVCIAALVGCDAVCLLKDWNESRGAMVEHYIASMMGMRIIVYKPSKRA